MEKVKVIAEVGINHNGSLEYALELIDCAKEAGADAIKFQKRSVVRVYSQEDLDKPRESPWGTTNRAQKEGLEFSEAAYDEINSYCQSQQIDWFASAWDVDSQLFLRKYNLKYNKVASAMLCHEELLHAITEERKYTFISTGMSTLEEIWAAINIFEKYECPFELVHCNSEYPMSVEKANLKCIETLKREFGVSKVGYSSHSTGILPGVLAVVMGASSVEAHITLDRAMYGSDQSSSLEPSGFAKMVEYIRCAEQCIGDGVKVVTPEEEKIKAKLRRTKDY